MSTLETEDMYVKVNKVQLETDLNNLEKHANEAKVLRY